jgi:hypothetical protein
LNDVELHIAERDGNVELAARLRAEMDASLAAFLGGVKAAIIGGAAK